MSPLRPNTLAEAMDILARPVLVQVTAGGPPPRVQPHALLMDVGRVMAMAGIHRIEGEMRIGVNNDWVGLMRSSLLQPAAGCLADAAALMEEEQPGGVLLHALDADHPDNPIILALTALDARAELALQKDDGSIAREILPLEQALQAQSEQPHLLINVRFAAPVDSVGSALHCEGDLSPMRPDARAAAAFVALDPGSGLIATARLALAIPDGWPILCPAAQTLIGQGIKKEAIEAVVRLAQRNCPQPRASTPPFSLALSSHLIRETLDRAFARAQTTSPFQRD